MGCERWHCRLLLRTEPVMVFLRSYGRTVYFLKPIWVDSALFFISKEEEENPRLSLGF